MSKMEFRQSASAVLLAASVRAERVPGQAASPLPCHLRSVQSSCDNSGISCHKNEATCSDARTTAVSEMAAPVLQSVSSRWTPGPHGSLLRHRCVSGALRTLRDMLAGTPDMRKSRLGKCLEPALRPAVQTMKVDTFFRQLHSSAAEPMPEEEQVFPAIFMQAGDVVKRLPGASSAPVASVVQSGKKNAVTKSSLASIELWDEWSFDWLQTPPLTLAASAQVLGLPVRRIQHCRLAGVLQNSPKHGQLLSGSHCPKNGH